MKDFGLTGSVALVGGVWAFFFLLDPTGKWPLGVLNLVSFGAVIALGWLWHRGPGVPNPWIWGLPALPKPVWPSVAGVLLTAWGGGVVLAEVGQLLVRLWPVPENLAAALEKIYRLDSLVVLLPLMLIAPLTEEGLFRGLLLPSLARRYGTWAAIVFTSLLFSFVHLNLWQGIPAFAAGLYLGWLRTTSGGLALPLLAHAAFNGFPLLLAYGGLTAAGYNLAGGTTSGVSVPPALLAWGVSVLVLGLAFPRIFRLWQSRLF